MAQEFIVTDGRTLPPEVLAQKRAAELRHEIGIYRKNLNSAERWLRLNRWFATEQKVIQVRDHINHLKATIAEKQHELDSLFGVVVLG